MLLDTFSRTPLPLAVGFDYGLQVELYQKRVGEYHDYSSWALPVAFAWPMLLALLGVAALALRKLGLGSGSPTTPRLTAALLFLTLIYFSVAAGLLLLQSNVLGDVCDQVQLWGTGGGSRLDLASKAI